jgi:prolyl-tRNA synthetase
MKQSKYYIPTLKDVTSDAVTTSHKLMLRAGLMRPLAAGVFSWLPSGYKVLKKIMDILREEMDASGGQEFLLPALNPTEIWDQTGRTEAMGDVMFHIKNREGLVLAPTHEEIITYHAKQHISSYKDLPQIWYQIQSKFRNEPRPRSGVMRGRQFFMKDAYSMDTSYENLDVSYDTMAAAYKRIFDICGIKYFIVGASSGAMGGTGSQEFMVENEFGEDTCAVSDSGYAANIEIATSNVPAVSRIENNPDYEIFDTPNARTINDLVEKYKIPEERCAKSLVYFVEDKPVLILMRGNDELNLSKLESIFATTNIRPAGDSELFDITGANAGSIGPINLKTDIKIYADNLLRDANGLVSGANQNGKHYKNIDFSRDANIIEYNDFRTIQIGEPDTNDGSPLRVVNAIELGHIFKLGTKYSEALDFKFLDQNGKTHPVVMGSYGIGVERIMACYIEQNSDEKGITWDKTLAPFGVHLLGLNIHKSENVKNACDKIYNDLKENGLEILYDDRKASVGFKFKDADLIGLPYQIVAGDRTLEQGEVEIKNRRTGESKSIKLGGIVDYFNTISKE